MSAVVYADMADARAEALTPQVLIGEAQLAARVETYADAIVIPASVDPVVFNRILTLARKLAVRLGPFAGGTS